MLDPKQLDSFDIMARSFSFYDEAQHGELFSELVNHLFNKTVDKTKLGDTASFILERFPKVGKEFTKKLLKQYGLTPEQIIDVTETWDKNAHPYDDNIPRWKEIMVPQTVEDNLKTIAEIEKEKPGITRFLLENFGIRCFGRYPAELLIRQFEKVNDQKPYGVILYPLNDYNGAFYGCKDVFSNLLGQLGDDYNLRAVEARDKLEIGKALIRFRKRYQAKISFAIIGGHGEKETIQFGTSYKESNILKSGDLMGSGVKRTSEFFETDPTIILSSCSTGQTGGIGQHLSEIFGAKIIAPETETALKDIKAVKQAGKVDFSVEFDEGASHIYNKGKTSRA